MVQKNKSLHLGEILIRNGWLTWERLDEVLKIQKETGAILGKIMVERKYVTMDNLYRALAIQHDMTFVDFRKLTVPAEVIKLIPKHFAYQHHVMPLVVKSGKLLIATSNPMNAWGESEIKKLVPDHEVLSVLATPDDIEIALRQYYGPQ